VRRRNFLSVVGATLVFPTSVLAKPSRPVKPRRLRECWQIDMDAKEAELEARWLANGFKKLDRPNPKPHTVSTAFDHRTTPHAYIDELFWKPAVQSIERHIRQCGNTDFYEVRVEYHGGVCCVLVSNGIAPRRERRIWPHPVFVSGKYSGSSDLVRLPIQRR